MTAKVSMAIKMTSANIMRTSSIILFRWDIQPRATRDKMRLLMKPTWFVLPEGDGQGCLHTKGGPVNGAMVGLGYLRHYQSHAAVTYACPNRANKGLRHASGCRQRDCWHKQHAGSHARTGFKAINVGSVWSDSPWAMDDKAKETDSKISLIYQKIHK